MTLTEEQIREKIAKACGENVSRDAGFLRGSYRAFVFRSGFEWRAPSDAREPWNWTPDFLSDLNAMHEAEKVLEGGLLAGSPMLAYTKLLHTATAGMGHLATARQRAEAFVKAIETPPYEVDWVRTGRISDLKHSDSSEERGAFIARVNAEYTPEVVEKTLELLDEMEGNQRCPDCRKMCPEAHPYGECPAREDYGYH